MIEGMNAPEGNIALDKKLKPREHAFADAPGCYAIATLTAETIINPGSRLNFEQYVTGYGMIKGCKIQCYISSNVFDSEDAFVDCSIGPNDNKQIVWGKQRLRVENSGFRMAFEGLRTAKWGEESTVFIDASSKINSVLTELKLEKAPLTFSLKTQNSIKSGTHYIDFYMTYFNGREWITNSDRVEFKVRNFFERHNKSITWLAITASLLAIIRLAVVPATQWVLEHI